jgi:anti-anti-sigma factor
MDIHIKIVGNIATAELAGHFDFEMGDTFIVEVLKLLHRESVAEVVIDLTQVSNIDSSALGELLVARAESVPLNKSIVLMGASNLTSKRLMTANFDKLFKLV